MHPTRFDHLTQFLAASTSRRQALLSLGAVLAGVSGFGHLQRTVLAQTDPTPAPSAPLRPVFDPIFVPQDQLAVEFITVPTSGVIDGDPGTIFVVDIADEDNLELVLPDIPFSGEFSPTADVIDPIFTIEHFPALPTPAVAADGGAASPVEGFPDFPVESVCGVDDSQDVEFYDGTLGVARTFVDAHQGPVGNLVWNHDLNEVFEDPGTVWDEEKREGRRYCSGTLITDDLFLTAAHCFAQSPTAAADVPPWRVPRIDGTNQPISRVDIARNMHVDFNYQRGPGGPVRPWKSIPIIDLVEDGWGSNASVRLDYAIVQLAENPGAEFGRMRIASANAPSGMPLCIIGHPRGMPKRLEAGLASDYQGPNVYYNDIDTDGGSSGSCLLASPEGPLVGIHTNGGCTGVASGNNYGVTIAALLEASSTLRGLVAT